mmetsp:Transcript_82821/g.232171  ORF Transcript_82821/g.232171 Transcript_82821/m.232171 type:complete len:226 (+) Transcript_82821:74-751(+)
MFAPGQMAIGRPAADGAQAGGGAIQVVALPYAGELMERLWQLTDVQEQGFGEKRCCCCCGDSKEEMMKANVKAYTKAYTEDKKRYCGLAVSGYDGANPASGKVVGFIQLCFKGMPGMYDMPEFMRHACADDECYVEKVAVSGECRGQGIGKKLLDWAEQQCREFARPIRRLTLDVVVPNPAIRLYERQGYVVKPKKGCCDSVCSPIIVGCLMGYRNYHEMEKSLR